MMHVDKSKAPTLKRSQSLPDLSKSADLKGKGLAEQLAELTPNATADVSASRVVATSPVAEASASVGVVRDPPQVEVPKEDEKSKEPEVSKEDEKPKEPEKTPEEKPKEPTAKEVRQQKAALRKQTQIANGDKVREERAKKSKAPSESKEAGEERLKQVNTDKQLWEVKVRAMNLVARIDRVEPSLKGGIKATHKELAEQVITASGQKGADPVALGLQVDQALEGFEKDFSTANYKPRSDATSTVERLKKAGLDEALKYADSALRSAWNTVDVAMLREQWVTAKGGLGALESAFNALKGHMAYFKTLVDKRIPWLTDKLNGTADDMLLATTSAVNGRYKLDAAGLQKLRNRLDSNTFGTTERQHTEKAFEAVKGNDTNASNKLDELAEHGVIRSGGLAQKYKSSWDTGDGFSVEYTVLGIPQIVIHCHCDGTGAPKSGNASHWKLKTQKFSPGASHPVSKALLDKFIDKEANKSARLAPKY